MFMPLSLRLRGTAVTALLGSAGYYAYTDDEISRLVMPLCGCLFTLFALCFVFSWAVFDIPPTTTVPAKPVIDPGEDPPNNGPESNGHDQKDT